MQYFREIDYKNNLGFFRFLIENDNDKVIIKYIEMLNKNRGIILPDNEMQIIQMHIANIPDLITAIFTIFQSNGRENWETTAHGDKLEIHMSDNERVFLKIILEDNSFRVKDAFLNRIEFEFKRGGIYMNDPSPRIPTPSMIWVTDTLKQIHDEWEKQQGSRQGAQV